MIARKPWPDVRTRRSTLTNALRLAADQYAEDAAKCATSRTISAQFERQARDVRKLADEIDQADTITLED